MEWGTICEGMSWVTTNHAQLGQVGLVVGGLGIDSCTHLANGNVHRMILISSLNQMKAVVVIQLLEQGLIELMESLQS